MNSIEATTRLLNRSRFTDFFERLALQGSVLEISSREEFHSMLIREKARADRNGHGFSLITVEVPKQKDVSSLVNRLQKKIRTADEIGWFDHKTLGVLLYSTTAVGAWQFIDKNRKKTGDIFSMLKCSVYSYPKEWCSF